MLQISIIGLCLIIKAGIIGNASKHKTPFPGLKSKQIALLVIFIFCCQNFALVGCFANYLLGVLEVNRGRWHCFGRICIVLLGFALFCQSLLGFAIFYLLLSKFCPGWLFCQLLVGGVGGEQRAVALDDGSRHYLPSLHRQALAGNLLFSRCQLFLVLPSIPCEPVYISVAVGAHVSLCFYMCAFV